MNTKRKHNNGTAQQQFIWSKYKYLLNVALIEYG